MCGCHLAKCVTAKLGVCVCQMSANQNAERRGVNSRYGRLHIIQHNSSRSNKNIWKVSL